MLAFFEFLAAIPELCILVMTQPRKTAYVCAALIVIAAIYCTFKGLSQ